MRRIVVAANANALAIIVGVSGIILAALALTVYIVVGVRGNVVRIGLAALALTFYEGMGVRRNVVRIGFAALALTVYIVVGVGSNIVGILCAALALTFCEGVGVKNVCTNVTLVVLVFVRVSCLVSDCCSTSLLCITCSSVPMVLSIACPFCAILVFMSLGVDKIASSECANRKYHHEKHT